MKRHKAGQKNRKASLPQPLSVPETLRPPPQEIGLIRPIPVETSRPGPWGTLEFYQSWLEAPDALLNLLVLPSQQTVWHFLSSGKEDIIGLFREIGLNDDDVTKLTTGICWDQFGDVIRVFPPDNIVESLASGSRSALYRTLAQWPENPYHHKPLLIRPNDLARIFERSGLSAGLSAAISALTYRDCGATLFSDLPVLLKHVRSAKEERSLIRILTQNGTLFLRLKLGGDQNLDQLRRYWLLDERPNDALPLMESILRTKGIDSLDIAHLLPSGAKSRLFTYPSMADVMDGRAPDGFTSALNFFNATPVPIYADSPILKSHLTSFYRLTDPPFRFGDVLTISPKSADIPRHACVYIADDMVYTKNSADFFSPWIFMRLQDVVNYHVREREAVVSGWRRKDFSFR